MNQPRRQLIVVQSFSKGAARFGHFCGDGPLRYRWLNLPGFGPVAGENFRMCVLEIREFLINCSSYQPMHFSAAALEQGLVCRITDQCMLELVGGLGRETPHMKQVRVS